MPTINLTARKVESLKPNPEAQIDYWDRTRRSFGVRVSRTGKKSWVVMYRYNGFLRRYTFATYPEMALVEARELADEYKKQAQKGTDPAGAKAAARQPVTFADLAKAYLDDYAKKEKKSWQQDERVINAELLPRWRQSKPADIKRDDVRAILNGIVKRGAPVQANRVLALVRKIFNFGIAEDKVGLGESVNPCHLISRPGGAEVARDRVLNDQEIRDVWAALEEQAPPIRAAFRLILLTAQRGGEVKQMRWEDLDLEGGWWTIPASHAKNGLSHRVPLNPPAVAVLTELQEWYKRWIAEVNPGRARKNKEPRELSAWVFESVLKGGPVAWLQRAADRIRTTSKVDFVPHDLRRTAASLMTGSGTPRLVVSKILNHVEQGVTAVYDRHSYDKDKRKALNAWGRQLQRILSEARDQKVVPFTAGRAV
jgi:integrase